MNRALSKIYSTLEKCSSSPNIHFHLFGFALITRVFGALLGGFRADDDGTYLHIAQSFLNGEGLIGMDQSGHPAYSWLPPGMGLLRALFIYIFGQDELALRVFFVLMSSATMVLFFPLAKRFFSAPIALLASFIWIVYPPQWFWSTRFNPHTFSTNMIVICLWLIFMAWEKKNFLLAFVCGYFWAISSLMRGEYALGIAVFAAASLIYFENKKLGWIMAGVVGFGWVVGFAPWVIRNYSIHDEFILVSTNYGDNLWFAYNPNYNFEGYAIDYPPDLQARLDEEPSEVKRADILMEDAKSFIKKNPGRAAYTAMGNFLNFWRPWLSFSAANWKESTVYMVSYIPFFIFFLWGLWRWPWKDPKWVLVGGLFLYKMAIHIPFYVIVRFREAIFPLMLLIAVRPLAMWVFSRHEKDKSHV